MAYEVVVVGAGIGGLIIAGIPATRGINICLLERAEQADGGIS